MVSVRHLKKAAFLALLLPLMCATVPSTGGDLYVEQKVTTSGIMGRPTSTSPQKIWMTKDMLRCEDPGHYRAVIFRLDKNLILMLNTVQKTYQELSCEDFRESLQMGATMFGETPETGEVVIRKTGEKQKICKCNCYQVLVEQPQCNMRTEMWLTEDVSFDCTLFQQYLETLGGTFHSKKVITQWAALKGFPIKTVTSWTLGNMTMTSTCLVTNISQEPIPKSLFSPPPDYQKVPFEMPPTSPKKN